MSVGAEWHTLPFFSAEQKHLYFVLSHEEFRHLLWSLCISSSAAGVKFIVEDRIVNSIEGMKQKKLEQTNLADSIRKPEATSRAGATSLRMVNRFAPLFS